MTFAEAMRRSTTAKSLTVSYSGKWDTRVLQPRGAMPSTPKLTGNRPTMLTPTLAKAKAQGLKVASESLEEQNGGQEADRTKTAAVSA